MAEPSTYIKIDRNIARWRWYLFPNELRLFIHCLISANITDMEFGCITVKRGEFATSYSKLAFALQLSVQQLRTAMMHLKSTGEITVKQYPKCQVITVTNYDLYQAINRQDNTQSTGNQQAINRQSTGNQQQSKKEKNYITTTTTTPVKRASAHAHEETDVVDIPTKEPTRAEVYMYFKETLDTDALSESEKFYAFNAMYGWERLDDWKKTADLWIARIGEK